MFPSNCRIKVFFSVGAVYFHATLRGKQEMPIEKLLIVQGIGLASNEIDSVEIPIIKGGLLALLVGFIGYVCYLILRGIWFSWKNQRIEFILYLVGIWIIAELFHWFGGGHNKY